MSTIHKFLLRRSSIELLVALSICGAAAVWIDLHYSHTTPPAGHTNPSITVAPSQLECAERLPVNTLAGQVLMVGLSSSSLTGQAPVFKQYSVGGAVLMDAPANPNDGSIEHFKTTAASPGNPLLIATDEEGGQVQRFQSLGALPAPEQVANSISPAQAEAQIAQHGAKLKTIGIDMILGPLADVAPAQGTGPLGDRVFSNDPATVSAYVQAYVRGWQAAGLLPTLKHFPGLGSASGNTDYQPSTTPPLSSLEQRDFLPYKSLAGSGTAVMVGNQNVPGWFTGPASLSPVVDTYLRRQLGYANSFIITDSLDAAAITATSSVADAVVNAISAGNDMVIIVSPNPADATGDVNSALISQSEAALANAVTHSTLSKQQLATSLVRKLSLQHISACSLSSASSHATGN